MTSYKTPQRASTLRVRLWPSRVEEDAMLPAMSIVRKANRFRGAAIVFSAIAAMVGCGSGTTMSAGERQAIADSIARQVKAAYDLSKPKGLGPRCSRKRRSL